jgi:hypothetical protein
MKLLEDDREEWSAVCPLFRGEDSESFRKFDSLSMSSYV